MGDTSHIQPSYSNVYAKKKYYAKILSREGIYATWLRDISISGLFAEIVWMDITLFDLTQLGMGLLLSILPYEFKPYAVDYKYYLASIEEALQGIHIRFEPVIYEVEYPWMTNLEEFVKMVFKPEFQMFMIKLMQRKAKYGLAKFTGFFYDPPLARKYFLEVFHRLRLIRTPDTSWTQIMREFGDLVQVDPTLIGEIACRLMLLRSAQLNSFLLGVSCLGKSKITIMQNGYAVIPYETIDGRTVNIRYNRLEQLQIGLILDVTPLNWGCLLPRESIYRQEEGKKDPAIIQVTAKKCRGIRERLPLTPWAYGGYNKPEEMVNIHKSDRTAQYDVLQEQRRTVEGWVYTHLPLDRLNPVQIREYQNAVLQLIGWKTKRHKWGWKPIMETPEEQFREWWVKHWSSLGLEEEVLRRLYSEAEAWLQPLRNVKTAIGEKIRKSRRRLALTV